jgi:hypothetical protein
MSFDGQTRLWSNRYYLNKTSIDTQAHFNALADAVVAAEKAIYDSTVTITEVLYYAPGSDVAVWTRTYSTAGTFSLGTTRAPGEVAMLVRYATSQRTTKNHPLYLFNYYHGANTVAGGGDAINASQKSALQTYANLWVSGFSDGVTTDYKKAGPRGAVAIGAFVEPYLTHRDFPR